jgi:Flp pilus assembly pilin Flp
MPEYAVMLAVITPAIALVVVLLGDTVGAAIARVASLFPS